MATANPNEKPWHAAFPEPRLKADYMPAERIMMLHAMGIKNALVIDVRRTDYEGGCIRGSLNIPAQGFYWNRGPLYELAYKADMEWVVFTCASSSPTGRGQRCASWFLDHVRNTVGDENMNVLVLEGGVKGWVKRGDQFTRLMDGFDGQYWKEVFEEEEKAKEARQRVGNDEGAEVSKRVACEGDVGK
ncbi:hypothetical protein MBLNU230_g3770t1 [Neophaeotheca triangularis]